MLGLWHLLSCALVCRQPTTRLYTTTRYTIDTPSTNRTKLVQAVQSHARSEDRYWKSKPLTRHTQIAFARLEQAVDLRQRPIILDSGCGTGRSSLQLGRLFPDHWVLGVDRSQFRLSKNHNVVVAEDQVLHRVSQNVWLIRAELTDFWRLLLLASESYQVDRHYLLYPNPYPKPRSFKSRFYAHPAFPTMMRLTNHCVVRSNWKVYLDEFREAASVLYPEQDAGTIRERSLNEPAWTNFEQKYQNVGETTYELVWKKKGMND